ncbi:ATP-dependent helicase HrpB [Paenibacillus contaminans]|uniref:ATP-dependent helicase HrpB n=1 Tax=Paenibacillus contaminans TaxID=450362 RepID=A0A329MM14_9BACL|nr:ATP-dependent helicase HrpB [Paenibacillus contaminans]RAV20650.1 ATP-dependent helicase HrpB [Paenibacillus contaminans]
MRQLPIEPVLPELLHTMRTRSNAVLIAPPGAGKTTRVPLALLDEPWTLGRKIVMLEPRRLAARSAARFMASSLGEEVGETVGYRVRMDTRISSRTRIEVVTEGVLTRLLQEDMSLDGTAVVIFDEFHERSLQADLGLSLCLQSQAVFREDLKLLVMSATLDAEPVAGILGDAPIVLSEGKSYPVETRYLNRSVEGRLEPAVVRAVLEAQRSEQGDMLVFLPGTGEIRRVEAQLAEHSLGKDVSVMPLYGNLPQAAQDLAIAPCREGQRKIVLSTSIAETSLTVDGVRIVIDSGYSRVPKFSPKTGMTRLETVPVSIASADQRRGRAGRQMPGVCYRLWTERDEGKLAFRSVPEIIEADLAPLVLELAAWGAADPMELQWLDPPPAAAYAQARQLLRQLGALQENGTITQHGRRMAAIGTHPRLAHMILQAIPLKLGGLACELAALLNERDMLNAQSQQAPAADLRLRVEALREAIRTKWTEPHYKEGHRVDMSVCRRAAAEAEQLKRQFGIAGEKGGDPEACGFLLAYAFPDRIAGRKENGRFLLRSGRGAVFADAQPLSSEPYVVAAELSDFGADSRIYLAAPIQADELMRYAGDQIDETKLIFWDRQSRTVRARVRKSIGAIVLSEAAYPNPSQEEVALALLNGIRTEGIGMLSWTKAARQLQQRMMFMHKLEPGNWPDVSDTHLADELEDWLLPHLYGLRNGEDLKRLHVADLLEALLPWSKRRELEELVPTHIVVPSGSRIPIDYGDPGAPVLAVRLQEMFGLSETPAIGRGRVPLTVHLLSPAHRPVQVTRDLASFWREAYFEVKKDLKGRYPKHYWPDDPTAAIPTNRTRPRS